MKAFGYERPTDLEEACRILAEAGGGKKPLAGGTDLLVKIRHKALSPQGMVSLRDLAGLAFIKYDPQEGLAIGSTTRLVDVENSAEIKEHYPALAEATATIGSIQVRNRATIGGNICNAAPSADTLPILVAYGASAVITDGRTETTVSLEEFFTGPGQTMLKPGQLLKSVTLPPPKPNTFGIYFKARRSALDIAMVGVALAAVFGDDQTVLDAKMIMGAVAPVPTRALALEKIIIGRKLDDTVIAEAVDNSCAEACPITDIRSTEAYRNDLVTVYAQRALAAARAWAEKGGAK